ncbi:MAG TPA: ATP-binding protein, partial [Methylibium sp.]|nr:ATP-binding protein [Methylibium sp.]
PDEALLPFLTEHRLVTRYGAEIQICDRAALAVARVVPRVGGGRLDGAGQPCTELVGYQGRLHDRRIAARLAPELGDRPKLQLLVPVRGNQGVLGAVVAEIAADAALQPLLAQDGAPLELLGPDGTLGGQPGGEGFVFVEAPVVLPADSDLRPLGLGVRVGIDQRLSLVGWVPLAAGYGAGMLVLAALAFFVARRITERLMQPVGELERLADRAATGEPIALPAALHRGDELGRLAASLKSMADTLQHNNAQLAARVDELKAARNAAQQASVAKTEFLATMSHEIRTPMNAILGLSYLALQTPLDAKARDYVQKTHGAAENLLGILNGILDFSKVEAGRVQLEREGFSLRGVLDRVAGTAGVKAQAKGLALRVEVAQDVPDALVGDALRLGQVLLNLCDNAIKFTERGEVVLGVEAAPPLDAEIELRFSVGDTGSGIPADKQQAIFELFSQADASTTRRHGGTGLGLAIARKLVELMGGRIGVSSQLGSGSTFRFNARFGMAPPRSAGAAQAASAEAALPPEERYADLRGARVLVAEDNELNQMLTRELLERIGIEVLLAGDGRAAVDAMRSRPDVDLVLMDCQMPVMDGYAATRAIRADRRFARLPVLAMTANVLPENLASCRGAGMNDLIAKPIDVAELYAALQRWLRPAAVAP